MSHHIVITELQQLTNPWSVSFPLYQQLCATGAESRLNLLASLQDKPINWKRKIKKKKKMKEEFWGQGIMTLLRMPADWEDGGLLSQRTVWPGLEFRLLLWGSHTVPGSSQPQKGCVNLFFPAVTQMGLVRRFPGSWTKQFFLFSFFGF